MRLPFVLFIAALPGLACQLIDGDRIYGKDVASASPMFAALDPKVEIGSTPVPGVQRVMHPEELVRLAKQNGIDLDGPALAICFERETEPLTAEKLIPVLRQALGLANLTIEILDFSRAGVPRGSLEFSKLSLMPNGLWRGRVLYDQNRSLAIWVRTRVSVERTWVEAVEPLPAGKVIEASQLILRSGPRFPLDTDAIQSIDAIAGRRAVRTLPLSTPIVQAMLAIAHDVERGDLVAVEVKVGGAILDFESTAESSGRTGESIMVKNPQNGRSFLAKIQNKGHVVVEK